MSEVQSISRLHASARASLDGIVRRPATSILLHGSDAPLTNLAAAHVARRLICPTDCADGTCAACRRLENGNHPDLVRLDPDEKGKIGIEAVQQLQHQLTYGQYEITGRRVVVITAAHTVTLPAQHALLKTLEEPPQDTTIILTATSPTRLLETIVSRCRPIYIPAIGSASPVDAQDVSGVVSGDLLERLVAAHALSEAGVPSDALVRALHTDTATKADTLSAKTYSGLLDATLRLSDRLGANVSQRDALEAYVLEAAAC